LARSVDERDAALDAIVLFLKDTRQMRPGLSRADEDREAFAFAARRLREEEEGSSRS
jgi:hypothetical protein